MGGWARGWWIGRFWVGAIRVEGLVVATVSAKDQWAGSDSQLHWHRAHLRQCLAPPLLPGAGGAQLAQPQAPGAARRTQRAIAFTFAAVFTLAFAFGAVALHGVRLLPSES